MAIGTEVGRQSMEIRAGLDNFTQIKLVGVGGGGSNAVNRMIREDIRGVEFITVNTDAQALVRSVAPVRLRIGDKLTRGLGVGGDHKVGMLAAEESRNEIAEAVQGADMLFVTAGMGGGTGTGAAAVVAEVAKEQGILTIGVVTKPFAFEGLHRARVAEEGIIRLRERADTIIVIPNERLLSTCDSNISIDAAFKVVDDVLLRSVQGISEVITLPGHINLDFNDVRTIMKDAGHSWIGIGHACGERRAVEAARAALESPLFDVAIERAKRILFNIVGNDLSLSEVNEAADVIRQVSHPYAQIIFGLGTDPDAGEEVKLTLIATDFSEPEPVIIEDDDELPELEFEDDKRRSFRPWSR
jgi:cell division protein FtsZ